MYLTHLRLLALGALAVAVDAFRDTSPFFLFSTAEYVCTQALAIARDLSAAPEEARALEGIGHSHLQEGHPGQAAEYLSQALTIYQRIGAPTARRIQETLQRNGLASTSPESQPADPSNEGDQPPLRAAPSGTQ